MPIAVTAAPFARFYDRVSAIPPYVWDGLQKNEWYTNTILPHLLKRLKWESDGYAAKAFDGEFWITCSTPTSASSSSSSEAALDLMLSCTNGPVGKYPIFIATTHPHSSLSPDFLQERMAAIVDLLCQKTHPSRVYSVYAPKPISEAFAKEWSIRTGIRCEPEPYYDARVSYCTKGAFVDTPIKASNQRLEFRRADERDLVRVAELCYGFASESPPFEHTQESSEVESRALISHRLAWILLADDQIVSLVAVTRNSAAVATITKVYTPPAFRGHKYAEKLVRHVTKVYLQE
ncbi:hypothetical protein ONZ45_g5311 [Pleurotus djamor]|nr:hypothetical protein ONZ45_g5311 [Pleurotus djamor]